MNTPVHTSTSIHRCRDDMPGICAICLTTPAVAAVMKAAVSSALYCQEAGYLQEAIMPTGLGGARERTAAASAVNSRA
jgi:hypothetical protein